MKQLIKLSKSVFALKDSKMSRLSKLVVFMVILTGGLFAQTATAPSGSGTTSDPYLIETLDNLYWITQNSGAWDKVFKQTANIDASSTSTWDSDGSGGYYGFSPIGNSTTKFTGYYDGQNYAINALYISRSGTDNVGFFGYTDNANISNLGLTNVDITGQNYVGALKGYNSNTSSSNADTIINCYSTGAVSGYMNVGGLIGYNYPGKIDNCYSTCSVSAPANVGGLVGYTVYNSHIANCYSTGSVSATQGPYAGGFCYYNDGSTIENCYSTGIVSDEGAGFVYTNGSLAISNCFWDTETSGKTTGIIDGTTSGATGKTTSEMKTLATFTDESTTGLTTAWDFVTNPNDDAANDDIWDMDLSGTINSGYPYLSWQDGEDQSLPVELATFTATAGNGRVTLKWTTESEIDNLGFNIYRSRQAGGQFVKINDRLIPGAGSSSNRHEYDYTDIDVINGINYWYKLEDVDYRGNTALHGLVSAMPVKSGAPGEYCLHPNYPNPFNPVTRIAYDLPEEGNVRLAVYDLSGRKIKTLLSGRQESGSYQITWDGTDQKGELVSSGVYFLSITSGSYSKTHKMVFVR